MREEWSSVKTLLEEPFPPILNLIGHNPLKVKWIVTD